MKNKKLYRLTSDSHKIPYAIDYNGVIITVEGDNIPVMFWPDGTVCWEANLFILDQYRKKRSRKNKGGSLLTNAKNISHLIRYCYENKVDLYNLTDNNFKMFVNRLKAEPLSRISVNKVREINHIATIARYSLRFLANIDMRLPGQRLMDQVRGYMKQMRRKNNRTGKEIMISYWHHDSIPIDTLPRNRQPISYEAIIKLHEANASIDCSSFLYRRRYVLLTLLEVTGGRRYEVAHIKVEDILKAAKTGELSLITVKKSRSSVERYVPFSSVDAKVVQEYISFYRKPLIKRTLGLVNDHGYLFVTEAKGTKLSVNTLGNEIWYIAKEAKIDNEEINNHVFRHRYITRQFILLIQAHDLKNLVDVKKLLLSSVDLKIKVMQWSGHGSEEAVDRYIHLAFEELANVNDTFDALKARASIEATQRALHDLQIQLEKNTLNPEMLASHLDGLLTNALSELRKV